MCVRACVCVCALVRVCPSLGQLTSLLRCVAPSIFDSDLALVDPTRLESRIADGSISGLFYSREAVLEEMRVCVAPVWLES